MKVYNTNYGVLTEMQCKAKLANGLTIQYFKLEWNDKKSDKGILKPIGIQY